jgi:hypothetical protein
LVVVVDSETPHRLLTQLQLLNRLLHVVLLKEERLYPKSSSLSSQAAWNDRSDGSSDRSGARFGFYVAFDWTREGAARRRGEEPGELEYATEEEVVLSPPPCWRDWSEEKIRSRVAELVDEIEKEAEADRRNRGVRPLGVKAILAQSPHQQPKKTKKSPAPAFHAA